MATALSCAYGWLHAIRYNYLILVLLDLIRLRVRKSASRLFDGIGTFTRPFARQVTFLCVVSVVLTPQRFRTFTPFLVLAMLLFRPLGPRSPRPHRLRERTAILSSHEWSDSRTRVAPICTSKDSPSASMSLYVFWKRFVYVFVSKILFVFIESDHGCFSSSIHDQEQSILPD